MPPSALGRRTSKKKVDWAVSETRAIEILEKICMGMDSYMLSNAEDEASQEQRPEKTPEASFAYWQKVGIGRDYIIDGPVVFGASNDIQKSELLNFCHMTVERVEDAIIEAVRQARSDIREHFCEELLPYCRGEVCGSVVNCSCVYAWHRWLRNNLTHWLVQEGSKEKIRRANDPKYTGGDKDWMRKLKDDLPAQQLWTRVTVVALSEEAKRCMATQEALMDGRGTRRRQQTSQVTSYKYLRRA
eukprot:scaffold1231_cov369-Prasinococcus_capsulatus_cf.AAC.3